MTVSYQIDMLSASSFLLSSDMETLVGEKQLLEYFIHFNWEIENKKRTIFWLPDDDALSRQSQLLTVAVACEIL